MSNKKLLEDVYTNPKSNAFMSAASTVFKEARRRNPKITKREVEDFISSTESLTLHGHVRKRFPRNRTIASGYLSHFQSDLIDMKAVKNSNDQHQYIMTVIDVLSRFAWAIPILTKSPKHVREAFKTIVDAGYKPIRLATDDGKEYYGEPFASYLKAEQIEHYSPNNQEIKCGLIERFNRSLKSKIYRYFTAKKTHRYIDQLPALVKSMNNAVHRTTGVAPSSVNFKNAHDVWCKIYGDPPLKSATKFKFSVNDRVRISRYKHIFEKGYEQTFSNEIFIVSQLVGHEIPCYRIKDLKGTEIVGKFYESELKKVTQSKEDLYDIEKILAHRTRKGKKEVLVRWKGYSELFDSWEPLTAVKKL